MKKSIGSIFAMLLCSSPVFAGGLERAPQSLVALFEEGNYGELSFGSAQPKVKGRDFAGYPTGDVTAGYSAFGMAYKHQFTPNLSGAIIIEQPFGADVDFERVGDGGSLLLGGTRVSVDSTTYTGLLRYKFENNFSVHGGIRGSSAKGEVDLDGAGYSNPETPGQGGVMGYSARMDRKWGVGWVAGVAYEIPEYKARVSLTYQSDIEHKFDTHESLSGNSLGPSTRTKVKTPRSWNLEGQTGIAPSTLLFGSIRWVNWSEFKTDPKVFYALTGEGLVSLEDTTTYNIGLAHRFNETWSGLAIVTHEPKNNDKVSPLAPTNGRTGLTVGGIYTRDKFKVTGVINYSKLGDAKPETGGEARAKMRNSDLWGIGIKIGYSF